MTYFFWLDCDGSGNIKRNVYRPMAVEGFLSPPSPRIINFGAMGLSFIVAFSYILLFVGSICAQVSAPNCTNTSLDWVRPFGPSLPRINDAYSPHL